MLSKLLYIVESSITMLGADTVGPPAIRGAGADLGSGAGLLGGYMPMGGAGAPVRGGPVIGGGIAEGPATGVGNDGPESLRRPFIGAGGADRFHLVVFLKNETTVGVGNTRPSCISACSRASQALTKKCPNAM